MLLTAKDKTAYQINGKREFRSQAESGKRDAESGMREPGAG